MKKVLTTLSMLTLLLSFSHAQTPDKAYIQPLDTVHPDSNNIYTLVQQMPQYNGNMYKLIADSLHWPAGEGDFAGAVYLSFVIEENGTMSNLKVLRGVPGVPAAAKEAVRVVSLLKNWTAGWQTDRPVRVRLTMPIRFEPHRE